MSGSSATAEGIQFPVRDGRRSSTAATKKIFARAATPVDPALAGAIAGAADWRKSYVDHVRDVVAAGIATPDRAIRMARAGLDAATSEMVFLRDGDETPLPAAMDRYDRPAFDTLTIQGKGSPSPGGFRLPYLGDGLDGDAILRRLDAWEERGAIEPSCNEAVRTALADPDWFDLSDLNVVLLGAASEMGPLQSLLSWGAHVIAVDLPRPELWARIIGLALDGPGRLSIPVPQGSSVDVHAAADVAGMDLTTQTPEVRTWIDGFPGDLVIGNYVYADGANFVRLAVGVDVMLQDLAARRGPFPLAHLATPTDVYAVPSDIVAGARVGRRSGVRGAFQGAARNLTARRLYLANYGTTLPDDLGRAWGLSDCLVPQQGPNYALAKNLQRWRATVSRVDGTTTSANLAPATRTRSVMKNRVLAAAYSGAPRFGVEIFQSATSAALMAALLVHDLRNPKALAEPSMSLDHPYDLFVHAAAHGGLLRMAHQPRSVLPLAVLLGFVRTS
ncbi:MAG: hypothetical protein ACRDLB_01680 [Actinomycetota bacterium]